MSPDLIKFFTNRVLIIIALGGLLFYGATTVPELWIDFKEMARIALSKVKL